MLKASGTDREFIESCTKFNHPHDRVMRAKLYVEDAINDRVIKVRRLQPGPVRVYRVESSRRFKRFMLLAALKHCLLALVEPASAAGVPACASSSCISGEGWLAVHS